MCESKRLPLGRMRGREDDTSHLSGFVERCLTGRFLRFDGELLMKEQNLLLVRNAIRDLLDPQSFTKARPFLSDKRN